MTDTETLQKLFELAWQYGCERYKPDMGNRTIYQCACCKETVFFDHSPSALIPSLCRAKWGEHHRYDAGEFVEWIDDPNGHSKPMDLSADEAIQCRLLIMPEAERIAWLGEVFLTNSKGQDE